MTALMQKPQPDVALPRPRRGVLVHAQGRAEGAVGLAVDAVVPAHLLDGGEIVHFAIKPSLWFVPLVSLRWIAVGLALIALSSWEPLPWTSYRWYVAQLGMLTILARLGWGMLEWVSRLYVLTNRRVMRIHGVFTVELFECSLTRIQNTYLTMSPAERMTRVGSVVFQTAAAGGSGPGGTATWRTVARPLAVHEKLREAIRRAQNRGNHVL